MTPRGWWSALAIAGVFGALMAAAALTSVASAIPPAVTGACLVGLGLLRPGAASPWTWVAAAPGAVSLTVTAVVLALGHEPAREEGIYGMVEVALLCVLLAGAVRWLPGPQVWVVATLTATAEIAWIVRFLPDRDPVPLLAGCALWSVPSLLSIAVGGYPRLAASRLDDSVTRARAEQRRELERDLHDYVAHDLTGMIVQAQAARFAAADDPDQLREALRRIEDSGQRAMTSMDRALELLREGAGAGGSARRPGLGSLEELVAEFARSDAMPVRLTVDGPLGDLPREVDETLYRVCVESLTNVRRHAPGAVAVDVGVTVEPTRAVVVVSDRAPQQPPPARGRRRGGTGLQNARARVEALGGSLTAGPDADGWRVTACVPL